MQIINSMSCQDQSLLYKQPFPSPSTLFIQGKVACKTGSMSCLVCLASSSSLYFKFIQGKVACKTQKHALRQMVSLQQQHAFLGMKSMIFFFFYKIEILLQPNLSIYVCETPSQRLESRSLSPTPHKHLYLWNDHRIKSMQQC